jgi:hypothetical protein
MHLDNGSIEKWASALLLPCSFHWISGISNHPTVFFSHDKPANSAFSHNKPAKRTGWVSSALFLPRSYAKPELRLDVFFPTFCKGNRTFPLELKRAFLRSKRCLTSAKQRNWFPSKFLWKYSNPNGPEPNGLNGIVVYWMDRFITWNTIISLSSQHL